MTELPPERLFAALDATWAPLATARCGPFLLREGAGGGKRVSAATLDGEIPNDLQEAETAMRAFGQTPLFMVRGGEDQFDGFLASQGYEIVDPTVAFAAPARALAERASGGLAAIPGHMPLAAQCEVWAEEGIGPERIEVMRRSVRPQTYMLGRFDDRIAGTAFVACDGSVAMLHALTVSPKSRRNGVARELTFGSANWALRHSAEYLTLLTTQDNAAACALYDGIGMSRIAQYHYRLKPE